METEEFQIIHTGTESESLTETKLERTWRYMKYFLKKFITFLFSHIGLTCTVVVYTILGGFLFKATEAPNEIELRQRVTHTKDIYLDKLVEFIDDSTPQDMVQKSFWTKQVDDILRDFKNDMHEVTQNRNWDGKFGEEDYQWTFADALLFSVTVITTIGYGHIAPKTTAGKLLTILYAIAGIPLTMLCLRNIGNLMAIIFRMVYRHTCVNLTYQYIRLKRRRLKQNAFKKLKERGVSLKKWAKKKRSSMSFRSSTDTKLHPDESKRDICGDPSDLSLQLETYTNYFERLNDDFAPTYRSRSMSMFSHTTDKPVGSGNLLTVNSISQLRGYRKNRIIRPYRVRRNTLCAIQELETSECDIRETDIEIDCSQEKDYDSGRPEHLINYDSSPDGHSSPALTSSVLSLGDFEEEDLILRQRLKSTREMVPISVCLLLMTGYMILGAMMFSPWENWDFMTGFYFCFVTLTSIGFGDIVPGAGATDWDSDEKGVLIVLYLLFGMSLLAMSFHLIQEEVKHKFRKIGVKLGLLEDRLNKMLDKLGDTA